MMPVFAPLLKPWWPAAEDVAEAAADVVVAADEEGLDDGVEGVGIADLIAPAPFCAALMKSFSGLPVV